MAVILWKEVGLGIILFLARLLSIDEQLFEAAELDGASWLQKVIYVAIPQLSSVIQFYTLFSIITVFCWVFNYIFATTNGGPNNSTYVMELYIYKIAFRYNIPHVAASAAVLLLVFVCIIIYIQFRLQRKIEVEY
jgi:ABC-type sugar transport system permease subunit